MTIADSVPDSIKVGGKRLDRKDVATGRGAKSRLKEEGKRMTSGRYGPSTYRVKKYTGVESPYFGRGKETVYALYVG